jgi:ParB/RepB/Spo0J family partition protein
MKRHTESWIGVDTGAAQEENDHQDTGPTEPPVGDPQDPDESIYTTVDSNDPDSQVPKKYLRALQERATSIESEQTDPMPSLMRALGSLMTATAPAPEAKGQPAARARRMDRRTTLRDRLSDAADSRRDGHAKTVDREVADVQLSSISGLRIENIRLEEDETAFRALCESMKKDGQLQPVIVVAHAHRPGHYQPVAGFRRVRAAAELGWPTIRAVIHPAGSSDQELFFLNAVENAQRFKLSDYELACRAQLMATRFGTPLADYARRLGLSPARIQNLVRFLDVLPADIIAAWRSGDPLLSDRMLQTLSAMPHDEASEYWAAWKATHAASPRARTRDRASPRRSLDRPTTAAVSRLWVAVKRNSNLDENARDLILGVVDYCLGRSSTVPGLFDPRKSS